MIVCHCSVVSDRTISQAIDDGARTLGQVCQSTGAGKDCGVCVFSVKRLLCDHRTSQRLVVMEVEVAAS
jgi:bacterioferritin-associated ferredoxin